MLNRLFIVVGLIAILALAAAFVVPNFIQWGDYRDRLQEMASETIGAPVEITGDIKFTLLPSPQLNFAKVVVGPADRPVMTVEQVEAQFSLVDFFRDRYALTRLELDHPVIDIRIGADGAIESGVALGEQAAATNVSVANAQIVDGMLRLADARTGQTITSDDIDGELRLEAVRGPFAFQGTAMLDGAAYGLRLATAVLQPDDTTQASIYLRPADERFTLTAEGQLQTGGAPAFSGTMTYRQAPPPPVADQPVDAGKGDLVVAGKLELNADRALLSDYTVTPDENRAATRLLGAAEIKLGASPSFNAVISGTSLALPPRDATVEGSVSKFELVRLLGELPLPPVPGIPGTVGVDITELDLRAVALRNVRVDATAHDGGWRIDGFSAQLPGATALKLSGDLTALDARPSFVGKASLETRRLDALAQLWRKPVERNPLFSMPASLSADVSMVGQTLSLSNGTFTLDDIAHRVSAEVGFGAVDEHLNIEAAFAALSAEDSAALSALLPAVGANTQFEKSFPSGQFNISMPSVVMDGLNGTNILARGTWAGGVVLADRIVAEDLGGASFDARLTIFGSIAQPELSGTVNVQIQSAQAPALTRVFDLMGATPSVRTALGRSLPADLTLRLDAPSGEGGQELGITGKVATADMRLDAKLGTGFLRALLGPLSFNLDLQSSDATAMTAQLGLGSISLIPDDQPMHVVAIVEGTPAKTLEATVRIEGGADSIAFAGNLVVTDPEKLTGNGTLKVALSDFSAVTESLGAGGIDVPAVKGTAHVEFIGASSLLLNEISATSGGQPLTGSLSLAEAGGKRTVTGQLEVGAIEPGGLVAVMAGRQAALPLAGETWPDGPFSTGFAPRTTSGRISVTSPAVVVDGTEVVTDVKFDFDWDATASRIRQFAGTMGGGQVTLDAGICCAGPLTDKQVTGRMTLAGVALDAMLPEAVAGALEGKIDGAAQFDGTGGDVEAALAAMTGQGSYSIENFRIERLDAGVFAAAAGLENVLDADADALTATLVDRLDDSPFVAGPVSGSFTIAGGVLRSPNLAISSEQARLFGSTSLTLRNLGLGGGFVMTPTKPAPADSLVDSANAQIAVNLGGTLTTPSQTFDVGSMIGAMKAKALELEVERLEKLRAEDEARQKAAAAERARIAAEEERKRAEEAAAKKAADEAAAKARAEEEARRRAEEERQQQQSTDILGPLDLGIN